MSKILLKLNKNTRVKVRFYDYFHFFHYNVNQNLISANTQIRKKVKVLDSNAKFLKIIKYYYKYKINIKLIFY